jgi:hypothetical protein
MIGIPTSKAVEQQMIPAVEDDLGDLMYCSPNCTWLFSEPGLARVQRPIFYPKEFGCLI